MRKKILLIRGTGVIGTHIRDILKNKLPDILLFIGTRKCIARDHLAIDITKPNTFHVIKRESIDLIVLCTNDSDNNVLRYCLRNRIDYIDITKPTESLKEAYRLAQLEKTQSKIVFSSGWMGGIIPSLVSLHTDFLSTKEVKIYIYYSLRDKQGRSSADFMAENVSKPFEVYKNGRSDWVRYFENPEKYSFMFNSQSYSVYNFDIPDVYILSQIENIPSISTKITYNSSFTTTALAILQRLNVFKLLSLESRKKLFFSPGNGDVTAFEVISQKMDGSINQSSLQCTAGQAYLTALSTCLHIDKVINSQLPDQIYFNHQFYQKDEFMNLLKKNKHIKIEIK